MSNVFIQQPFVKTLEKCEEQAPFLLFALWNTGERKAILEYSLGRNRLFKSPYVSLGST